MTGRAQGGGTLIDLLRASGQPLSRELTELLAAYGPPPEIPAYRGDILEYTAAVNLFQKLTATPEAVARREALERYFSDVPEDR